MSFKQVDLSGQRFGKLVVSSFIGKTPHNHSEWRCVCDCGGETVRTIQSLRRSPYAHCGCTHHARKHGQSFSPSYSSWRSMISRCEEPSSPAYEHYRKHGITVCERWRHGDGTLSGFECFFADMGERPSLQHTLDRTRNDGNYEPSNVRWATKREQANNRRTNVRFEWQGKSFTLTELARETGLGHEFLRHRLCRAGWTVEEALTIQKRPGQRIDRLHR